MEFSIGDRVAYSRTWLRSVGAYAGDLPGARGTVVAIEPLGQQQLVTVDWQDDGIPDWVISVNLAKVGPDGSVKCWVDGDQAKGS